jgi:hypothetical protein
VPGLGNLHGELHAIGKVGQPSPGNSQCTFHRLAESEYDNVWHGTPSVVGDFSFPYPGSATGYLVMVRFENPHGGQKIGDGRIYTDISILS